MWSFDGQPRAASEAVKVIAYSGAMCTLKTVFDDYEEMTFEPTDLNEDALDSLSLANRAVFAAETFLMLYDDSYKTCVRAFHQAFFSHFIFHTYHHVMSDPELRPKMLLALRQFPGCELYSTEDDEDAWFNAFTNVLDHHIPDEHFELAGAVLMCAEEELDTEGSKLALVCEKHANFFLPYTSQRISTKIDALVAGVRETIEKNKKYPI